MQKAVRQCATAADAVSHVAFALTCRRELGAALALGPIHDRHVLALRAMGTTIFVERCAMAGHGDAVLGTRAVGCAPDFLVTHGLWQSLLAAAQYVGAAGCGLTTPWCGALVELIRRGDLEHLERTCALLRVDMSRLPWTPELLIALGECHSWPIVERCVAATGRLLSDWDAVVLAKVAARTGFDALVAWLEPRLSDNERMICLRSALATPRALPVVQRLWPTKEEALASLFADLFETDSCEPAVAWIVHRASSVDWCAMLGEHLATIARNNYNLPTYLLSWVQHAGHHRLPGLTVPLLTQMARRAIYDGSVAWLTQLRALGADVLGAANMAAMPVVHMALEGGHIDMLAHLAREFGIRPDMRAVATWWRSTIRVQDHDLRVMTYCHETLGLALTSEHWAVAVYMPSRNDAALYDRVLYLAKHGPPCPPGIYERCRREDWPHVVLKYMGPH